MGKHKEAKLQYAEAVNSYLLATKRRQWELMLMSRAGERATKLGVTVKKLNEIYEQVQREVQDAYTN